MTAEQPRSSLAALIDAYGLVGRLIWLRLRRGSSPKPWLVIGSPTGTRDG